MEPLGTREGPVQEQEGEERGHTEHHTHTHKGTSLHKASGGRMGTIRNSESQKLASPRSPTRPAAFPRSLVCPPSPQLPLLFLRAGSGTDCSDWTAARQLAHGWWGKSFCPARASSHRRHLEGSGLGLSFARSRLAGCPHGTRNAYKWPTQRDISGVGLEQYCLKSALGGQGARDGIDLHGTLAPAEPMVGQDDPTLPSLPPLSHDGSRRLWLGPTGLFASRALLSLPQSRPSRLRLRHMIQDCREWHGQAEINRVQQASPFLWPVFAG